MLSRSGLCAHKNTQLGKPVEGFCKNTVASASWEQNIFKFLPSGVQRIWLSNQKCIRQKS